jgi:FdhE protein
VPTSHPEAIWRLATAQWAEITANLPDLEPAVVLQRRLLRLMLDSAVALDTVPAPMTPTAILDKWARGLPALRNEAIPIPPTLKNALPLLCTALAECGAGESALHIRDAITSNGIDADSLLSVSLARNRKAIRTSALHLGFSPDLVWLIGELGSAPLAHRLASAIVDRSPAIDAGLGRTDRRSTNAERPAMDHLWNRGYCPVCGSWPAFIEAHAGARSLRCSYCAVGWPLQAGGCIYCANADARFVAAAPDVNRPERRVELCGRCSGYTKVIEVAAPTPFPLQAVADLATMDLDHGAMNRGYRRPELFDLEDIEPQSSPC